MDPTFILFLSALPILPMWAQDVSVMSALGMNGFFTYRPSMRVLSTYDSAPVFTVHRLDPFVPMRDAAFEFKIPDVSGPDLQLSAILTIS